MKTCPRCGVENKPEKAACWNCWSPLDMPTGGAAQPSGRGLSLTVPWTAVAVVALVLIAGAATYFFFLSSKPAQVAEQYLDAIKNGNTAKADRLSTRESSGQKLPTALLIASYDVPRGETGMEGGQAMVPVTVHFTVDPLAIGLERAAVSDAVMKYLQRHPVRARVVLVKERLNWRVDRRQTQQQFMQSMLAAAPAEIRDGLTKPRPTLPPAVPGVGVPVVPPPAAPATPAVPGAGIKLPAGIPRPGVGSAVGAPGAPGGVPTGTKARAKAKGGGALGARRAAESEAASESD
jgi:hypothetical protein